MKPKKTDKQTPNEVNGRDSFQTPNYATDLLVPFIPKQITHVWECAAGHRKIANRLEHHGYIVLASDIDISLENVVPSNFITDPDRTDIYRHPFAIITNPPYSVKDLFIEKCLNYDIPFALLVTTDYYGKMINYIQRGCEKIIPTRRIDYITPHLREKTKSYFHTGWLTYKFNLGKTETFVELSLEDKKNI